MAAHVINKQSFEFFCNSEKVAQSVQHEIEHYTAFHINNIISSVLDERDEEIAFIIDRIEIDLGNVQLKEFGNADMLNRFREIFNEKLSEIYNEKLAAIYNKRLSATYDEKEYFKYYRNTAEYKNGKLINKTAINETAINETDFELLESFLLTGDIPWWSDKNIAINFDAVIQKLAKKHPSFLKKFLTEHRGNTSVLSRLFEHSKPQTISLINELIPGDMPEVTREDLFNAGTNEIPASLFSDSHLGKIKKLSKRRGDSVERQKDILLKKILRFSKLLFAKYRSLNFPVNINKILPDDAFGKSLKEQRLILKKNIEAFTTKLTVFQVEFLLFQLSLFSDAEIIERVNFNSPLSPDTPENLLFRLNDRLSVDHKHAIRKSLDAFFLDIVFLLSAKPFNGDAAIPVPTNKIYTKTDEEIKDELKRESREILFTQTENDNIVNEDTASSYLVEKKLQSGEKTERAFADEENRDGATFKDDNLTTGFDEKYMGNPDELPVPETNNAEGVSDNTNLEIAAEKPDKTEPDKAIKKNAEHQEDTKNKIDFFVDQNAESQPAGFTDKENNKSEKFQSSEDINNNFNDDKITNKRIDFIARKLRIKSPGFRALLKQLRKKDIDILFKRFKKRIQQSDTRKRCIESILEHPYLLKYNLLKLSGAFAHIANAKGYTTGYFEKREIKPIDAASAVDKKSIDKKEKTKRPKPVYSLLQKELIIVKDVFNKARFDSVSEKKVVRKLLLRLPEQNIALLKFFTELPGQEIHRLSVSNEHILENILSTEKQEDLFFNQPQSGKIYIENSGLCLITAYLLRFFRQLGYLENNAFKNKVIAARAVYVLQYIVTGKNRSPEYVLQLNKLLCGFDTEDYINASVRLTKKEMKEADDLLAAVIEHWKALRKTSIQGFRQSFLQRKGILSDRGTSWSLQVERKGFDILLSTIPWSFGILKLPWMKKHIHIEW